MGGRVYRAGVATPASPPVGRVYRARVAGTAPAAAPRGRVYSAGMAGTVPAVLKGRVYRARVLGTAAVVIAPIPAEAAEPATTVELTALLVGGTPAETYAWRVVSGPAVTLMGSGHTRTFIAPSTMDGTTIVIGVRATVGATTSTERTITITVPPQIMWTRTHADPTWRGTKLSF